MVQELSVVEEELEGELEEVIVETSRRPGSTGRHISHQRRHHICLDMGRMITCHTCITLMAEP